jgi:hypothetical protein
MDSSRQPPGGDPQDYTQTQEIGPPGALPWGQGKPSQPAPGGHPRQAGGQAWGHLSQPAAPSGQPAAPSGRPPAPPSPPRRYSRALWWGAGLALVALLAGGGVLAATNLAGSASAAPPGPTGQAAQLNSLLNSASSPSSAAQADNFALASSAAQPASHPCLNRAEKLKASGHPFAAARAFLLCANPLERIRLIGGIDGQFTFKTKDGTVTLAYLRGAIESVTGNDVVVQASDGTTWTWVLQSNTVVRQDGKKASSSALAAGQRVFAAGPLVSGVYQARLIVIQPSSASPSPSPTPATGS